MNRIYKMLNDCGAIQHGHFELSSGLHSNLYVQCARALQHTMHATTIAKDMTAQLPKPLLGDVVLGAAHGGTVLAFETGRVLYRRAIFAERTPRLALVNNQFLGFSKLQLRRGLEIKPGEKVLIVEDVVTTGETAFELMELVANAGAKTTAVVSIIDRSSTTPAFDVPFYSLLKLDPITWEPHNCLLCQKGEALVKPGSRQPV